MKTLTHKCCGCSACALVCPYQAITMSLNTEGFYGPVIDADKCVSCELCITVCIDTVAEKAAPLNKEKVYVAAAKDKHTLERSSSGGVGHILAERMVLSSQIACGAAYSEKDECAAHIVVDDIKGLGLLQGSKYIQSNSCDGFSKAIQKGEGIIFGTPCQIAGVDAVLKQKKVRDRFVLVDIFCHGVPSYLLWNNHLRYLKQRGKVAEKEPVSFRQRDRYILSIGKYAAEFQYDAFFYFFLRGLVLNIPCYTCPYRRSSYADVRIGDLAINKYKKKYKKLNFSPSVIIINTDAGERVVSEIAERLELYPESYHCVDNIQDKGDKPISIKRTHYLTEMRKGKSPMSLIRCEMAISYVKGGIKTMLRVCRKRSNVPRTDDLQSVVNER